MVKAGVSPRSFAVRDKRSDAGDAQVLSIEWADGHQSEFPLSWLRAFAYDVPVEELQSRRYEPAPLLWDASLEVSRVQVTYDAFLTEEGKNRLCLLLMRFGFAVVTGVPPKLGTVGEIGNQLGAVRRTNYGDIFDVLDMGADANNLAYTPAGVTVHTDNCYRDPVPGIQLLHCLKAASVGGDSIISDGYAVAARLWREDRESFEVLARWPRNYRYWDASMGVALRGGRDLHVIQLEKPLDGASPPDQPPPVKQIHFNNRSAGPLQIPFEVVPSYYKAWAAFQDIAEDPSMLLKFKLNPGDLFVFNNHRALHGRTSYSRSSPRHLQGCYIDIDAVRSRVDFTTKQPNYY